MFLTFLGPPTYLFDDLQYCKSSKIAIIIFAENSQILLKISVIPILLFFVYLVALKQPTQLIIVAHNCHLCLDEVQLEKSIGILVFLWLHNGLEGVLFKLIFKLTSADVS